MGLSPALSAQIPLAGERLPFHDRSNVLSELSVDAGWRRVHATNTILMAPIRPRADLVDAPWLMTSHRVGGTLPRKDLD